LAQHVLVRQSRMEVSLMVASCLLSLRTALDVSKLGVVGDAAGGDHAHLRVALRHAVCLRL